MKTTAGSCSTRVRYLSSAFGGGNSDAPDGDRRKTAARSCSADSASCQLSATVTLPLAPGWRFVERGLREPAERLNGLPVGHHGGGGEQRTGGLIHERLELVRES